MCSTYYYKLQILVLMCEACEIPMFTSVHYSCSLISSTISVSINFVQLYMQMNLHLIGSHIIWTSSAGRVPTCSASRIQFASNQNIFLTRTISVPRGYAQMGGALKCSHTLAHLHNLVSRFQFVKKQFSWEETVTLIRSLLDIASDECHASNTLLLNWDLIHWIWRVRVRCDLWVSIFNNHSWKFSEIVVR